MSEQNPLGRLIDNARAANGWSYQQVADRATAAGFRMSKSNVAELAKSNPDSVSTKRVQALAAGLGLPPQRVLEAFIASMGFDHVPTAVTVEEAVAADDRLSIGGRRHLLALLESLRD